MGKNRNKTTTTTMSKPTLTYFGVPGRAEPIRLAFFIGGIEFEDTRITYPEFGGLKQSGVLPNGQVPVLDLDGKRYFQSIALLRYAGKRAGLYPDDPLLALQVDQAVDTLQDLTNALAASMSEKDEKKIAMRKKLAEETIPKAYTVLESLLGDKQFMTEAGLSIADLCLLCSSRGIRSGKLDHLPTTVLDGFPNILALAARLEEDPKIK